MRKFLQTALGCLALASLQPSTSQAQIKGPSSSQTPYLLPVKAGVITTSILTTGDIVGGYTMCGTPDGIGAFDNGNGTFTLVMNHEFGNTAGVVRAHGSRGAFISRWIVNKSNLSVVNGSDLIQQVKLWNGTTYTTYSAASPMPSGFNRFCSADLPAQSAFYNAASGKGTLETIFMNGEESGAEGRAFAHIVTGPNMGTSWELPYLGKFSWENSIPNPGTGDVTVVAGTDDATPGQVYFYVGMKSTSGNEIEKAGLLGGHLWAPAVAGMLIEPQAGIPAPNTPFTMVNLGDVHNMSGAALQTTSTAAGVTQFLRPEDGAWDPAHPEDFYFVTTNAFSSPSRMWKLHFSDLTDLSKGGTITAVLDGTEGQRMLDNMGMDHYGHSLLQEDVGNNAHNGKIWQYSNATDALELIAKHDVARFGDIGIAATAPYNQDEESSGIVDVQAILGSGYFLFVDQAHYSLPGQLVEGGQLLALFNPDTFTACASFPASIEVSPSPAIAGQDASTIYLGYGPQMLTLTASAPPDAGPYSFSWSNGSTSASITASPVSITAYTATVTNQYGCSTTVSQTVKVVDIRDGAKDKVFICHKGNMQSVSVNAVPAHFAHGDKLGSCEETSSLLSGKSTLVEIVDEPLVFPNPVKGEAKLSLNLTQKSLVAVTVTDLNGKQVMQPIRTTLTAGRQSISLNTASLAAGNYLVNCTYGNETMQRKIVVMQ